jgi:hypothetical protein
MVLRIRPRGKFRQNDSTGVKTFRNVPCLLFVVSLVQLLCRTKHSHRARIEIRSPAGAAVSQLQLTVSCWHCCVSLPIPFFLPLQHTMGRGLRPETHTEQGTMAAAVMRAVGPPSVLKYETDFPMPMR